MAHCIFISTYLFLYVCLAYDFIYIVVFHLAILIYSIRNIYKKIHIENEYVSENVTRELICSQQIMNT